MGGARGRDRAGPGPRFRGTHLVWVLNFALAGCALALYLGHVRYLDQLPGPHQVPAPAFLFLFGLSEAYVFHLYFRRQAHAFSLSEFPLVLGLFFLSPEQLILARVIGSAAALIVFRRNPPVKLAFNLSLFALETGVVCTVFRWVLGGGDAMTHRGWLAAATAVLAASSLAALMTQLAISMVESHWLGRRLPSVLALGLSCALANASLGLIAVTIAAQDLTELWLLAVPLLTFFFAYRAYAGERLKHQRLGRLYEFSRKLQGLREPEAIMRELLKQAREMSRAEFAEAILFGTATDPDWLTVRLGPADAFSVERTERNPHVAQPGSALLDGATGVTHGLRSSLQSYLASDESSASMVVRLRGERQAIGILLVANRVGKPRPFDSEERRLLETVASQASVAIENARLEQQLRRMEARSIRVGRILDDSATEFYIVDPVTLRVQQASRAAVDRLGFSPVELQDMSLSDLMEDLPARRLRKLLEPVLRGTEVQVVFQAAQRCKDGSSNPVEARIQLSRAEEPPLLLLIVQDISERLRAREAVRESEAKSHFLATMSHELRTPLNSILGFAQLLGSHDFGPLSDRQRRYVGNIESSGRQLLALINDILDLSKIEAGRMEVNPEVVAISPLLEDCMAKVRPLAEERAIDLHLSVVPELHTWADARRVTQVVLNLLSNAVKFTPREGQVAITAEQAGESMRLQVKDTGIGIAPENQARIFDEFTQIDSTLSRESTGTGLGLPLSRRLATLMGGSLMVESKPGAGSTFTVLLPLEPPAQSLPPGREAGLEVRGRAAWRARS